MLDRAPKQPPPVAAIPLALFSMMVLALEVLLSRILAYSVHPHLLYVVLGVAMLGFGAAGSLVAVRSHWLRPERVGQALAWAALAAATGIIVAHAVFVRLTPSLHGKVGAALAAATVMTLPFLAAGTVITLALASAGERLGLCYAANLVGSGLGCFLPMLLLGPLDAEQLLALLAAVAWVAAAMYVGRLERASRSVLSKASWATLVLVALAFVSAGHVFPISPEPAPAGQLDLANTFARTHDLKVKKLYDRWNATGRIEIFEYGPARAAAHPYPYLFYVQDSGAGSMLAHWDGRDSDSAPPHVNAPQSVVHKMCTDSIYGQGYFLRRPTVLIIGLGGGPDLQCALFHKATSIDVVEINPDSIAAVRGPFNRWLGGIGSHPHVRFHNRDGRSFAHSARGSNYDLIQLTGTDTKQNLVANSLTLSQNYLYTREAFVDYIESLNPSGVLVIIRFGEAEALRLANTAVWALRKLGARRPHSHIAVFQTGVVYGAMIRKTPFSTQDIKALLRSVRRSSVPWSAPFFYFTPDKRIRLLYMPGGPSEQPFGAFFHQVARGSTHSFAESYPFNIAPSTDDRPFFFDVSRYDKNITWKSAPHIVALRNLLLSVLSLSVVLIILPVWRMRDRLRGVAAAVAPAFFASLGLAYLLIEVWMLHRFSMFLGHQTYGLSVVLSTLLVSSGLGAWAGERVISSYRRRVWVGGGLILAMLAAGALVLPHVIETLWEASLPVRALATMAFVSPAGIAMGLPFPAGLKWIQRTAAGSLPWCVGINGFASVLATILVIPLSLWFGHSSVLLTGAALYALAAALSVGMRPRPWA